RRLLQSKDRSSDDVAGSLPNSVDSRSPERDPRDVLRHLRGGQAPSRPGGVAVRRPPCLVFPDRCPRRWPVMAPFVPPARPAGQLPLCAAVPIASIGARLNLNTPCN